MDLKQQWQATIETCRLLASDYRYCGMAEAAKAVEATCQIHEHAMAEASKENLPENYMQPGDRQEG